MLKTNITVGSIIKGGFKEFKRNWGMLILIALIITTISGGVGATEGGIVSFLMSLCIAIISPCISLEIYHAAKENRKITISGIFEHFNGQIIGTQLLSMLYIFLWSLLFVIPGIVKSFAYQRAIFIADRNPGMAVQEAINASQMEMMGHKGTYFLAQLVMAIPGMMLNGGLFAWIAYRVFQLAGSPEIMYIPREETASVIAGLIGPTLIAIFLVTITVSILLSAIMKGLEASFNVQLDKEIGLDRPETEEIDYL